MLRAASVVCFAVLASAQPDFRNAAWGMTQAQVTAAESAKPQLDRAYWSSDALQDEPKSYLEHDRATATGILPTDRSVGLSIASGQVEYLSVELEGLESQIRAGKSKR